MSRSNGIGVTECRIDEFKGADIISCLEAEGMCFRFANFLQSIDYDETPADVYSNTSPIRDCNTMDIYEPYTVNLDDSEDLLEINTLYSNNGVVTAVLYDPDKDEFVGEFDLPIV